MGFEIRKAEKKRRKLRLALIALSKGGKTMTSLLFARELAGADGKIGLIDTEGGNSEIYAGEKGIGDFGIIKLDEFSPQTYIEAMRALVDAGCAVVIIDSLSHAWAGRGGVLEIVDQADGKNKWTSGWGKATPMHNDLITAINHCPVHLIATMRQKGDYILTDNGKGSQMPKKVGMAAVQREGMEYEFDITGTMIDANLTIDGVRGTSLESLKDKTFKKPGAEFIKKIVAELDNTAYVPPAPAAPTAPPEPPAPPVDPMTLPQVKAVLDAFAEAGFPLALARDLTAKSVHGMTQKAKKPDETWQAESIRRIKAGELDKFKPKTKAEHPPAGESPVTAADIDAAMGAATT